MTACAHSEGECLKQGAARTGVGYVVPDDRLGEADFQHALNKTVLHEFLLCEYLCVISSQSFCSFVIAVMSSRKKQVDWVSVFRDVDGPGSIICGFDPIAFIHPMCSSLQRMAQFVQPIDSNVCVDELVSRRHYYWVEWFLTHQWYDITTRNAGLVTTALQGGWIRGAKLIERVLQSSYHNFVDVIWENVLVDVFWDFDNDDHRHPELRVIKYILQRDPTVLEVRKLRGYHYKGFGCLGDTELIKLSVADHTTFPGAFRGWSYNWLLDGTGEIKDSDHKRRTQCFIRELAAQDNVTIQSGGWLW